ncbi:MAG: M48 family metallopeptidase, partial [Thermodesulfobacteriota bacterium]|nr:M48 family metallopeptidase [Thermodesulfobacteriota bacterium]
MPDALMLSMSFQQYDEFLRTNKLSKDKNMDAIVKRVGRKIQKGVEEYFSLKNRSYELNDYKWEFNLVENQQVNAWCMPGGKVVVYTGILKVTDDEDTLAVVIAHEIAHAVAKHGNERMSHGLLAQMGGIALSNALKEKPAATKKLWMSVFGLGAQFGVILPYS